MNRLAIILAAIAVSVRLAAGHEPLITKPLPNFPGSVECKCVLTMVDPTEAYSCRPTSKTDDGYLCCIEWPDSTTCSSDGGLVSKGDEYQNINYRVRGYVICDLVEDVCFDPWPIFKEAYSLVDMIKKMAGDIAEIKESQRVENPDDGQWTPHCDGSLAKSLPCCYDPEQQAVRCK